MTNSSPQPEPSPASKDFSFGKDLRILKRAEFLEVYARGKQVRRRLFVIFALPQNGLPPLGKAPSAVLPTRIGITASKKSGRSHVRNRLRRRMREVFRLNQHHIAPGWLLVANMTRHGTDVLWDDFVRQFRSAIREHGLWSAAPEPTDPPPSPPTPPADQPQTPHVVAPPSSSPIEHTCDHDTPGLSGRWAIALLRGYKSRISPHLPPMCRFEPTCSIYAMEAYRKKSFIRATLLTLSRLLRCNPFSRGGYDPVE